MPPANYAPGRTPLAGNAEGGIDGNATTDWCRPRISQLFSTHCRPGSNRGGSNACSCVACCTYTEHKRSPRVHTCAPFLAIGTELAGSPAADFYIHLFIVRSIAGEGSDEASGFASADIVPRTPAAAAIANLHICPTPKRYGASIKAIWKRKIEPTLCSLQGALAGRSPCER